MKDSRRVYSTEAGRIRPAAPSRSSAPAGPPLPNDGVVRVFRDRGGRNGKVVTVIRGLPARQLEERASDLRRLCAAGVDPSPALLAIARDLAEVGGLGNRVELHEGSALALPFADGAFDVAIAVTALSHTPGAEGAIPEMARVVRPGGRIGVFDLDT